MHQMMYPNHQKLDSKEDGLESQQTIAAAVSSLHVGEHVVGWFAQHKHLGLPHQMNQYLQVGHGEAMAQHTIEDPGENVCAGCSGSLGPLVVQE
jgi:hypothetical protein